MNDQKTVRLVIVVLALLALAVVIGGIVLALTDRGLPGELIAIGSAAAGAVGGILSHTSSDEPTPVNVVNPPEEAVPVAETPAKPRRARGQAGVSDIGLIVAIVLVMFIVLILWGVPHR